ncbi:MAG: flagellar hook-basal body protein [Lachnospiraceae bacterium]|nr:flagellar hook-basal body protein [Lachnospiraceae bacterium]
MLRALYTGSTGMETEQKRLDVISNNLANATTVGYKKEGVTSQSFDDVLALKVRDESAMLTDSKIGTMSLGVKIGEVYTDYSQGSLRETGNTYDLAIEGNGFFAVETTDSKGNTSTRYTRAGQFMMNQEGYIVDSQGNYLMGESGRLKVDTTAGEVLINVDGSVYADGELVDKVTVKDFTDYNYLKKGAGTMYEAIAGANEKEVSGLVRQGFTEQSNVSVVSEMVSMISISRAYEANQKVIQSVDSTLELAVSSVGKI